MDETKNDANEKYAKFEQLKLDAKALELQWHLNTGKWSINKNVQLCVEDLTFLRKKGYENSIWTLSAYFSFAKQDDLIFLSGIGTFELIRQAINCCKEMCEITREKKLDNSYLVPILEDGFLAASRGFLKSSIDHPAWFGLA